MSGSMRVVSGIQPTGDLHLGNLLGAILRWVRMQDEAECLFFLADLHALTVDVEPEQLRSNVREMAAALIASGIDPTKSIIFAQSAIPAHAELTWILQCTARVGWLNRMIQFKEKSGKHREGVSVGLYTYPVLQAADILLYKATHVPVGEDQKQHVELARDIAIKFNTDFDIELFVPPEPFIGGGSAARIMSQRSHEVGLYIARMTKIVIAAINGPARGAALELALCADIPGVRQEGDGQADPDQHREEDPAELPAPVPPAVSPED